ncbi:MAG: phosphatase PAP2 family protein [Anaerolineales bacterium]|nr:phosphatase PAP2 family protein [Anaerolineales bacterium]
MQSILDLGIQLILILQDMGNWLITPMQIFSFLGTEQFFLIIAPVVYWCISPGIGLRLGLFLMTSASLNDAFKVFLHAPRPYWIDTRVKTHAVESSFGIPSGHSMNSATLWGALAVSVRKQAVWMITIFLIFLIGLSRLYLGMHFPTDVLVGWLMGALLIALLFWMEKPFLKWIEPQSDAQKIIIASIFSLILIAFGYVARLTLTGWALPATWIQNAASATGVADTINPLDPCSLVSSSGALFGLALGYILLESMGGFQVSGSFWHQNARFFIGLVGILLFWKGLDLIFPDGVDIIALSFRYIRYTLIGAWVTGGAPWVFIRLGVSKRKQG